MLRRVARFLPSTADYRLKYARVDLLAGVTVAVVALPLALGFGVTSGGGATAGIVTAVVAGFVAAFLGGSNYQVTGPTGAMTAVLLPMVAVYGAGVLPLLALLAGIILIAMSLAGIGRYVRFIPWPVVTGFTNGIAVIIFLQQLPNVLGVSAPHGESIVLISYRTVQQWLLAPSALTIVLALLTVAVMVGWSRVKALAVLPASMAALLVVSFVSLLPQFENVARIGTIPRTLPMPQFPMIAFTDAFVDLARAAIAVAVLAALESLLCAVVGARVTVGGTHDPAGEVIGQGLGNIASSLFGGLPSTAALARTAVNVRSGARTRLASMSHAVVLLAVVLFLAPLASRIPLAVLGGILMVVAVRMIERHATVLTIRSTKSDAFVLVLTFVVTVLFDLILAIEVGLVAAAILFIVRMSATFKVDPISLEGTTIEPLMTDRDVDKLKPLKDKVVAFRVEGPIFFGAADRFIDMLLKVDPGIQVLILRLRRVPVLDATGVTALQALKERLARQGVVLLISGLQPQPSALLRRTGVYPALTAEGRNVFETTEEAIAAAGRLVTGDS